MKEYQNILFDMDGTLVDSEPGILESLRYTLDILKIKSCKDETLQKFLGPPLKNSFQSYLHMNECEANEAVKIFRQYYSTKGMYKGKLYKNIVKVLEELYGKYDLFIATSKPTLYTVSIAKRLGISQYFEGIVGSNLDNSRSKKEEVIQYLLKEFSLKDKTKILMIGDKAQDIVGARCCGIDAIGVSYGYGTIKELMEQKPLAILNMPEQLINFLEK